MYGFVSIILKFLGRCFRCDRLPLQFLDSPPNFIAHFIVRWCPGRIDFSRSGLHWHNPRMLRAFPFLRPSLQKAMHGALGHMKLTFLFKDLGDLPIRTLTPTEFIDESTEGFKARSRRFLRETVENFIKFAFNKSTLLKAKIGGTKTGQTQDQRGTNAGHGCHSCCTAQTYDAASRKPKPKA
jgi:hypothetical protein